MPSVFSGNNDNAAVFICLTPVKNEAWILPSFLRMVETWADWIIILDQCSTDGSREIARKHNKVILLENDDPEFDERYRQSKLLSAARQIPGKRILFALDADESLSANFVTNGDKEAVAQSPPGTVIELKWPQILPQLKRFYDVPHTPFGFVDNGAQHNPKRIHSTRIPTPDGAIHLKLQDTVNMHFQYVPWERQKIKQLWYQCWETVNSPENDPIRIFRQYNQMRGIVKKNTLPIRQDWIAGYQDRGIDFNALEKVSGDDTWWEKDIVSMLSLYGADRFRKTCIWDVDWVKKAASLGFEEPDKFVDPRGIVDRIFHKWLIVTQAYAKNYFVRVLDKYLIRKIW